MSLGGDGMGGDLCVKGVDRTCDIGYLTHLEALRYCQVRTIVLYCTVNEVVVVVVVVGVFILLLYYVCSNLYYGGY